MLIFVLFSGYLGKNNIHNVSSIRSVRYEQDAMKVYKASNISSGISIKYKGIEFENNMRVTSHFTVPINGQSPGAISKRYDIYFITCDLTFNNK